MCGIIGYVGYDNATPLLLSGLKKLEYRGYDSAGVAVHTGKELKVVKTSGKLQALSEKLNEGINLTGNLGIGHTRWATHGKPSKENAHPHMDNSETFAVVHNGIIENYTELRKFLTDNGYKFLSQTDTEVIPNLIHYHFSKDTNDDENKFLRSVQSATKDLKGSFAIEVLCNLYPDKMVVVRKDSPLVIGKGTTGYHIASDIPALLEFTRDFYLLDDYEFALIEKNSIKFYNSDLVEHSKEIKNIEWDSSAAEKSGYEDYMLKEIFEQPTAIRETIGSRLKLGEPCNFSDINITKEYLSTINKIFIIACGTAMHAGLTGKKFIENLCNIPVEVDIASEFRYRNPIIDEKTLCIFISQSGETADTIAALKLSKSKGAKTLAVSNVIGSSITREADYTIYTHAGPEIAVASTKAYTSQVVLLGILAIYFAEILESTDSETLENLKKDIFDLPKKIETSLKTSDEVKKFAKKISKEKDVFFIGRGSDYNVALEGSLKLKEISYIHSEAYASGELKHGPIALIEKGITVISILTDKNLLEKSISNIEEVITRGAKTFIVTNQNIENSNFDNVIKIEDTNPLLSPILSVMPLQLLAYYISKDKGLDVDKPRNLAKSVTVE